MISQDTQAYLRSKEIEHITTTPYHPQANGRVERLNSIVLTALRRLAQENASSWVKHLPTALHMSRSRVNRDIHFSPFKMVYGYKPGIQDLPKDLRLVVPDDVPRGNDISPELRNICNLASEQGAKRICEQVIKRTDLFKINNEVWALNPDKRKLKPEMISLYTVITVNHDFKTCRVQDKNGKKKNLYMDSLRLVKAWVHHQSSKFAISNKLLKRYGAQNIDAIPK